MEKTQEIEYETIQLKIPKAILNLLRDFMEPEEVEEYLTYSIITCVKADLDNAMDTIISPNYLIKKYGLDRVFNQ